MLMRQGTFCLLGSSSATVGAWATLCPRTSFEAEAFFLGFFFFLRSIEELGRSSEPAEAHGVSEAADN